MSPRYCYIYQLLHSSTSGARYFIGDSVKTLQTVPILKYQIQSLLVCHHLRNCLIIVTDGSRSEAGNDAASLIGDDIFFQRFMNVGKFDTLET